MLLSTNMLTPAGMETSGSSEETDLSAFMFDCPTGTLALSSDSQCFTVGSILTCLYLFLTADSSL
jgi:hypothetical protein